MKSILVFLFLIVLSSCAYFDNEIFENNNQNIILEPGEEADDKSFFGPGYSFWKELRSVERGKIELSREYKNLEEKPNGYTSWIGHSSFIINNFDLNIITDPIFSERASPFSFFGPKRLIPPAIDYEDLPNIDVIVISHNHYDHLDKKTIKNLNKINSDIIYLVPLKLKKWFEGLGAKNVYEFNWWEEKKIKNTTFTFVPVQHWSRRGLFDKNKTLWGGWWIENDNIKLVHLGDTGYTNDFIEINKRLGSPDLAFIPIGAYAPRWIMKESHMNPEEALKTAFDLDAKKSIGMHWGTFILTTEPTEEPRKILENLIIEKDLNKDFFSTILPGDVYLFDWIEKEIKK
ncbi:MBL fold metallo-hydrolase [Rhodobiaceae bacterium]|nr:MBL fold metallo-hydrolase [Rhodobiaceae bacterium]